MVWQVRARLEDARKSRKLEDPTFNSIGVGGGRAGRATALPIFSCFSPFSVTVCWSETQEKGRAATVAKKRFLNEEVEGKRKLRVARDVRTQLTE